MIKYTVILLNMLGLMLFNIFNVNDVEVSQTVPTSVKAGDSFTIEITVKKGNTGGFAKLQQDLPAGWSAEAIKDASAGASFTFRDQTAKFIWMSLPAEEEFKVSFKVMVGTEAISGDQKIEGKFAYVFNNVKNTVNFTSSPIAIINERMAAAEPEEVVIEESTEETIPTETNTDVATSPEENVATEEPVVAAEKEEEPAEKPTTKETAPPVSATSVATEDKTIGDGVVCFREHPKSIAPGEEFVVKVKVVKNNLSGFAKLQEMLPDGFTAESLENQGASFTFADQKLKYVWVSLPAMDEFTVSYKVKAPLSASGTANIDGLFSYIENDETKKRIIEVSSVNIVVPEAEVIAETPAVKEEEQTTAIVSSEEEDSAEPTETEEEATTMTEETSEEEVEVLVEEESTPAPVEEENAIAATTNIPAPETAMVNYKVQICALKKKSVAYTYFQDKYKISDDVYVEAHEGWTKYTTGGFNIYKAARDHRETIKNKGVEGPFVTAYNEGNRITVQEALMISKQQWYR